MVNIISKLKKKNYRITRPRERILECLTFSPLEVKEIANCLKKKGYNVDLTTIYRTLGCLENLGLIIKTQFEDKSAKYELNNKEKHHHHLVCERCGSIEDVPLNESLLINQINNQSKFKILRHNLEFFGICESCQ